MMRGKWFATRVANEWIKLPEEVFEVGSVRDIRDTVGNGRLSVSGEGSA